MAHPQCEEYVSKFFFFFDILPIYFFCNLFSVLYLYFFYVQRFLSTDTTRRYLGACVLKPIPTAFTRLTFTLHFLSTNERLFTTIHYDKYEKEKKTGRIQRLVFFIHIYVHLTRTILMVNNVIRLTFQME